MRYSASAFTHRAPAQAGGLVPFDLNTRAAAGLCKIEQIFLTFIPARDGRIVPLPNLLIRHLLKSIDRAFLAHRRIVDDDESHDTLIGQARSGR